MELSAGIASWEVDNLEIDLANGEQLLVSLLTAALALHRDPAVRGQLGTISIALGEQGPYINLDRGGVEGSTLHGTDPISPVATIEAILHAHPKFLDSLRDASPIAARTIAALTAERVDRATFETLEPWAPLLALHAYRHTVTIQALFDLTRASSHTSEQLRTYWNRAHQLGHLTLLATAPQPRAWLAGLARAFTWRTWTPSFPLVRERILRLAVRGGWASARFGSAAIGPYLERLAMGAPLHAFDAVLGLVSLATALEGERASISTALFDILEHREQTSGDLNIREAFGALARSARLAIESPREAQRLVIARDTYRASDRIAQLVAAVDSDEDAGTLDEHGMYPAILAMAGLATAPARVFFAEQATFVPWRPARARGALERTFRIEQPRPFN